MKEGGKEAESVGFEKDKRKRTRLLKERRKEARK